MVEQARSDNQIGLFVGKQLTSVEKMKLLFAFTVLALVSSDDDFISKEKASSFLRRVARSNRGNIFEEFNPGNLERECIEEVCSTEEAFEISDNRVIAMDLWQKYSDCRRGKFTSGERLDSPSKKSVLRRCVQDDNQCSPNPCVESSSKRCEDLIDGFSCVCKPGYEGNVCDKATDKCLISSCDKTGTNRCVNTANSYRCECKSGYDGTLCDEVTDMCLISSCNQAGTNRCVNTDSSYRCQCKPGYAGVLCDEDQNECESNPCGRHGSCVDGVNKFECRCDNLYSGTLCEIVVDDCRLHDCSGNGKCVTADDVYTCVCDVGYTGENCTEDTNECLSSPCQHDCTNTLGSYKCSCRPGFLFDLLEKLCKDIDECVRTSHGCSDSCVNTVGSFHCACRAGFKLDTLFQRYCGDIDECEEDNGGCEGKCLNEEGSYYCVCHEGFVATDGGKTCQDKDECAEEHGCQHGCINNPGSYECLCPTGFLLNYDKTTCRDINECAASTPPCDQKCFNSPGNYSCDCYHGYERQQDSCVDIDECATDNGRCNQLCVNNPGSYQCECTAGFELVGRKCFDIRECASSPCVNGRCTEGFQSFSCLCYYGYSGVTCQFEGDPCLNEDCNNGTCVSLGETASCSCNLGFTGKNCLDDVDECQVDNGHCTSQCLNTIGSHMCVCGDGYETKENKCVDLNECEDEKTCDHDCNNTMGSFVCNCRVGFVLSDNERNCDDINECNDTPCQQNCHNFPGSFNCSCSSGYQLSRDGMSCDDIDECASGGTTRCQQKCLNTIGSFQCACAVRFQLSNDGVTCEEAGTCFGNIQSPLKGRLLMGMKTVDFFSQKVVTELRNKIYISVKFRTFGSEGVIFALNDASMRKYAYVAIVRGNIQSGYENGSGYTSMNPLDPVLVSDGQWHVVKFRKAKKFFKLVIDGVTVSRSSLARSNVVFQQGSMIYIGGLPTNHNISLTTPITTQYRGCLSNLHVKGGKAVWTSSKRKIFKSRRHCFADVDRSGYYFSGSGYAKVDYRSKRDFKLAVKIRTGKADGIITAMRNSRIMFYLMMSSAQLKAEIRDASGQVMASSTYNSKSLCGGLWVSINLRVTRGHLKMRVNGVAAQEIVQKSSSLPPNLPLYVGGVPDGSESGFNGNIKRIYINDRRIDLSRSSDFAGVNVMTMPR